MSTATVPTNGRITVPQRSDLTSRTLKRVGEELRSGRHPLIPGHVAETVFLKGQRHSLPDALVRMGRSAFDVVVFVDAAFGLTVLHGEDAVRRIETTVNAEPESAPDLDLEDLPDRERRFRRLREAATPAEEPIDRIYRLLCQDEVTVLVVMDQVDISMGDPVHEPPERRRQAVLRRIFERAAHVQRPGKVTYRNTLMMLAGQESKVPEVLLAGHEEVAVIQVEHPTAEERQELFEQVLPTMPGCGSLEPASRMALAGDLARRTEGDSLRTLLALAEFARSNRLSPTEPAALVSRFRFGDREDHWGGLKARLAEVEAGLRARIVGQDDAVELVRDALAAVSLGLRFGAVGGMEGQPLVLWFLGPTGVGKTEMAKVIAELLFGDPEAYHRIDMGGYGAEHHRDRLIGAPPGYIGSDQGGQLTEPIRRRPNSVIVLDEIEKAHPKVLDTLLSIFEDGRVTDARGQVAYFGEAVFIVTSNVGGGELRKLLATSEVEPSKEVVAQLFRDALVDHSAAIDRPELTGRIESGVVPFDIIREESVVPITQLLVERVCLTRGPDLEVDLEAAAALTRATFRDPDSRALGARSVRTLLQQRMRRVTAWLVLEGPSDPRHVRVQLWPDGTVVEVDGGPPQALR